MKIQEALAHCDIPCKIYDPIVIQIAALTVVRIIAVSYTHLRAHET